MSTQKLSCWHFPRILTQVIKSFTRKLPNLSTTKNDHAGVFQTFLVVDDTGKLQPKSFWGAKEANFTVRAPNKLIKFNEAKHEKILKSFTMKSPNRQPKTNYVGVFQASWVVECYWKTLTQTL